MSRITKADLSQRELIGYNNGLSAGREIALKQFRSETFSRLQEGRLKLLESLVKAVEANAQIVTSIHRMMDEGLGK